MIKYPMKVFTKQMQTFPINVIRPPTPLVMKNVPEFLRARTKADRAAVQKLSPVRAI